MRALAALMVLALFASPLADDEPEVKAKDAALALLKAVKTKDVEEVMKLTDVPFVYHDDGFKTHKDKAALKAWLMERLEDIKDVDKVPTEIDELLTFAVLKQKIENADEKALAEEVLGKDGYFAVVHTADDKKAGIAVRIKDGKAKIVGLVVK